MLNKYLIFTLLIYLQFAMPEEELVEEFASGIVLSGVDGGDAPIVPVSKSLTIGDVLSCVNIARAAFNVASFAQAKIIPTQTQKEDQAILSDKINALKTEKLFHKCLVENTRGSIVNGLPEKCQNEGRAFMMANDIYEYQKTREEFVLASANLAAPAKKGWSLRKKILIGGGVILAVCTGTIFLAPIVAPGSVVASQATALQSSATLVMNNAKEGFTVYANDFVAIATKEKLSTCSLMIDGANTIRPFVYANQEEEYQALVNEKKNRPSLTEQIKRVYAANAK